MPAKRCVVTRTILLLEMHFSSTPFLGKSKRTETLETYLYARICIDNSVTSIKLLSNKSFTFSKRNKSQHAQAPKRRRRRRDYA
jgi:hypothetical protein